MVDSKARIPTLGLIICLLLLAACSPSEITDPNADVTVSGTLLGNGDQPISGVEVRLSYRESVLSFLSSPSVLSTTTDPSGRYSFRLKGRDLNFPGQGGARTFTLTAQTPTALEPGTTGPRTTTSFRINREQLPIDLRIWDAQPALGDDAVTWNPLRQDHGEGTAYSLVFDGERSAQAASTHSTAFQVWSAETDAPSLPFDPRVLADTEGIIYLSAKRKGEAPGTTVTREYRAQTLFYTSQAGAPLSRGKPCHLEVDGERLDAPTACRATDGIATTSMAIPRAPQGEPDTRETRLVVDLGAPSRIDLVVVRDCECPVEISSDGSAWSPAGAIESGTLALDPPKVARFVRVNLDSGSIGEIAIWPPT